MPSDSSIISVLLSIMWTHPESEQLLVMVYSLLTIISSQGESARPSLLSWGCACLPGMVRLRWVHSTCLSFSVF